jgi:hypothetical protein
MSDNGGKTSCYDIPVGAKTLDDLIEHKGMSFWMGNIFKTIYAFNERSNRNDSSSCDREHNKIEYYNNRGRVLNARPDHTN